MSMSLETRVMESLKEAMKAKNEAGLRALRAIKAAIIIAKTEPGASENGITEDQEVKLIQKLIKQRKDSLDIYVKQDRPDLMKIEQEELDILATFLPAQLSEEEIRTKIKDIASQNSLSQPSDLGKLMGLAIKELVSSAEGKLISSIVKETLNP